MSVPRPSSLVSVIVPAWQEPRHADTTLRSVYDQDHEAVEIVVVEAGADQGAGRAIRAYLERDDVRRRFQRIVVIQESGDPSASHTINRGLQASHGDFVNILQAGDALAAGRFSRLLAACADKGAGLAFSRVEFRTDTPASSSSGEESDYLYSVQDEIEFFPTVGYALLRSHCALSIGNLFFSRRLAEGVGGFADHEYCYGWDFALRCLLVTEPIFVPEALYISRLHGQERFEQHQAHEARGAEAVLKNYFFLCRNRPVLNPVAPSPAWGPFFDSFLEASRYGGYLTKP